MGLRNKAHDLIINSKTMKGINKGCVYHDESKNIDTCPGATLHSSFYLFAQEGDHFPY